MAIATFAVDYLTLLPTIPAADEKIMAEKYEVYLGGVAGNIVMQVARKGRAGNHHVSRCTGGADS